MSLLAGADEGESLGARRHAQIVLHDLGFDKKSAEPLSSPSANDVALACQGELPEEERTKFRSITLRPAFMAPSVFDAASEKRQRERCRWPRCRAWLQPEVQWLTVKVDSDFAGCKESRLSTSCCILMRGKHVIRCSSPTRRSRA